MEVSLAFASARAALWLVGSFAFAFLGLLFSAATSFDLGAVVMFFWMLVLTPYALLGSHLPGSITWGLVVFHWIAVSLLVGLFTRRMAQARALVCCLVIAAALGGATAALLWNLGFRPVMDL